ncbi:MAG: MerR family transcriptional regulator [Alphaproteobacteria bacterium]|nr:MerR family transcriptional regulator [Alphaproteobacteria bacterium]
MSSGNLFGEPIVGQRPATSQSSSQSSSQPSRQAPVPPQPAASTGVPPQQGQSANAASKAPSAFRTISEVAGELEVPQHVLRFWESKFPQVRPLKRGGGRRYYRPEDISLLRQIQNLLYSQGYTIRGVQKVLRENRVPIQRISQQQQIVSISAANAAAEVEDDVTPVTPLQAPPRERLPVEVRKEIEALRDELKSLRAMLKAAGV